MTRYYSRTCSEGLPLVRGQVPAELAHLARINSRQWRQYESDCNRENAIVTGMRYLRVFDRESVTTYAQAAELLGVSRQRVYQFVSLVTKLPAEVHDVLLSNEDRALARHFT